MISPMRNLGGNVTSFYAAATNTTGTPIRILAAGTGDNTANTGASINRMVTNALLDSGVLQIAWLAALGANETLALAVEYQESSDNSNWDTAVALQASTIVATDSGSGSNMSGVTTFDIDLSTKKQYIRFNFTPNLSRGATDVAIAMAIFTAGGIKFSSLV